MPDSKNPSTSDPATDKPILRTVILLFRHWRFLLACFLVGAIISGIIAFTTPNSYKAVATFLPPQKQSGLLESVTGGLSSTLKSFGFAKSTFGGSGVYSYLPILKSMEMSERMMKRFDLLKVYDINSGSTQKAREELNDHSEFSFEEEGHISVSVEDSDPKRAAEMANAFVEYLNEINTELNVSEAHSNRIVVEKQYNETLKSLAVLEDSLMEFQKRTKIYSLPDQAKIALSATASIRAQMMYQQVAVAVAERTFGSDDADVQLAKVKLQELQKSIDDTQNGKGIGQLLPPIADMPKEVVQYARLFRDYEIYSKFLGFLVPMYQQAKIDEIKETRAVVLLDKAQAPDKKSGPKRSLIIAVTALSFFTLGVLFLFVRDRIHSYKENFPNEWESIARSFKQHHSA